MPEPDFLRAQTFRTALRNRASLIPVTCFARTACSAPRDFGPARENPNFRARAKLSLVIPPQKINFISQGSEIKFDISKEGTKRCQMVVLKMQCARSNGVHGFDRNVKTQGLIGEADVDPESHIWRRC
ncbi:hypothetical protein B0H11DRAFT_1934521 [Mycena galericulata]|nr:hypothetical protein B0H11DRAFT_1934521 [Mycena galericulata]